jgi:DNA polymerase
MTIPQCKPSGPTPARLMIVGEAPGSDEVRTGEPFVGLSGKELTRMLHDAGILRSDCRITNVTMERPEGNDISTFFATRTQATTDHKFLAGRWCSPAITSGLEALRQEVAATNPSVILALGDTALWALTGETGITKWRGSYLDLRPAYGGPHPTNVLVIPTYHPAAILRQWSWRFIAVQDMRRVAEAIAGRAPPRPAEDFDIPHTLDYALAAIDELARSDEPLSCDIETRVGHIDCIGFATSPTRAICFPFFSLQQPNGLWSLEDEATIVLALRRLLSSRPIVGQNFLYDAQYIARHWGLAVIPAFDTMIAQGVAFPGLPKALDFLSSMYLPWHRYWKDESQEADAKLDDSIRWRYNCKDCCTTWALRPHLEQTLSDLQLTKPFAFEMALFQPLLMMMLQGVSINTNLRGQLMSELMAIQQQYEQYFDQYAQLLPEAKANAKPWYRSPKQQQDLFYNVLGQAPLRNRKTGNITSDDEALEKLGKREPLLLPLTRAMQRYRSTGVFLSTFIQAPLDWDKRIRSSYNPVGTETLRFSSRADAFGYGTNLQNIPKGE